MTEKDKEILAKFMVNNDYASDKNFNIFRDAKYILENVLLEIHDAIEARDPSVNVYIDKNCLTENLEELKPEFTNVICNIDYKDMSNNMVIKTNANDHYVDFIYNGYTKRLYDYQSILPDNLDEIQYTEKINIDNIKRVIKIKRVINSELLDWIITEGTMDYQIRF